jgi:SAM-dependent methyltransferase
MHGFRDATHSGSAGGSDPPGANGHRADRAVRSVLAAAVRSADEDQGPGPSWHTWAFDRVLAHTPEVAAVLDVAAGTGMLWSCNYDRLPMAWWVWLTDESPGAVSELRNALDGAPQVTVAHGRLGDLPLGDAAFDTVVANHILDDLENPEPALDEIVRVLRPGGTLIVGTDGSRHLRELTRLLNGGKASHPAPSPRRRARRPVPSDGFDLESGQAILAERFTAVRCERFAGKIQLADADAVLALFAPLGGPVGATAPAGPAKPAASDEAPPVDPTARIRAEVGTVVERYGHFSLTIDTGILVATAE